MKPEVAEHEIKAMEAVLETLMAMREALKIVIKPKDDIVQEENPFTTKTIK